MSNGHDLGKSSGWLELAVTLGIQSIASMALLALPVIATLVGESISVPTSVIGAYVGLVYLASFFGSLSAGTLVGIYGPIRISQICLFLSACGMLLCCIATVQAIIIGAAVLGLGYGGITPASSHILSRSAPPQRMSLIFSIKQTGVPLGGILAGALLPSLSLAIGWRYSLAFIAAVAFAFMLIAQGLRNRLDSERQSGIVFKASDLIKPIRLVASIAPLRKIILFGFSFSSVQLCLTTYAVIYLTTELKLDLVFAGFILSACQFSGVIARIICGVLADAYFGAIRTLSFLTSAIAACCFGITILHPGTDITIVISLMIIFGATAIGWNGVFLAEVSRISPKDNTSLATGGAIAFTNLGAMIAPPVFALISSYFGSFKYGFTLLGIAMLFSTLGLFLMLQKEYLNK